LKIKSSKGALSKTRIKVEENSDSEQEINFNYDSPEPSFIEEVQKRNLENSILSDKPISFGKDMVGLENVIIVLSEKIEENDSPTSFLSNQDNQKISINTPTFSQLAK
jgi:hypothetical protein